nr:MAG TPA: hypothetical protein [Caudoviricetes sp.]
MKRPDLLQRSERLNSVKILRFFAKTFGSSK